MLTRRHVPHALTLAGLTLAAAAPVAHAADGLSWQAFPAGPNGFFRASVLLTGPREAILIDGGFTLSDGRAVAAAIQASGKRLTTILVTQSDPDYYFGLAPIRAAFPAARIIAAPETVAAIRASVQKKLETWGPQLRENGPQSLADVVIPEASAEALLRLDGEAVEIIPAAGLANRRHVRVPALDAVLGGVLVFAGLHVWTADTPTAPERAAWVANLNAMAARDPRIVVPGHMAPGAAMDASALIFTRDYLRAFEEELAKPGDSAALIAAMRARYPTAGLGIALEIGAKVAKGEMRWG
ncbi:MAG: MBL fold metallo-hydrolase [Roseococcus sp.]|nr:MBL fold metallo-hydrolase [Roseococcus sp.]